MAGCERLRKQTIQYRLKSALFSRWQLFSLHLWQGRKGYCNSSDRQSSSCFNLCRFRQFVFRVQCLIGEFVGRLDYTSLVNTIQCSRKSWGRVSRSIWHKICHWSQCIAIHFERPGICLGMFVICWPCLQIRASDCAEYYSD